jgi:hypothetical protein
MSVYIEIGLRLLHIWLQLDNTTVSFVGGMHSMGREMDGFTTQQVSSQMLRLEMAAALPPFNPGSAKLVPAMLSDHLAEHLCTLVQCQLDKLEIITLTSSYLKSSTSLVPRFNRQGNSSPLTSALSLYDPLD